jgi:hypothetical protein
MSTIGHMYYTQKQWRHAARGLDRAHDGYLERVGEDHETTQDINYWVGVRLP